VLKELSGDSMPALPVGATWAGAASRPGSVSRGDGLFVDWGRAPPASSRNCSALIVARRPPPNE
jgi:hypothetical protein